MELYYSQWIVNFTFLISIIGCVNSKSVIKNEFDVDRDSHLSKNDSEITTKKCLCKVETSHGDMIHDFAVLESMPNWPDADCHYVHQRCRHKCGSNLELLKKLPILNITAGAYYCQRHGIYTNVAGLQLKALWKTANCPHERWHETDKQVKLCCGYTSIMNAEKAPVMKLGWNPDCKASQFILH